MNYPAASFGVAPAVATAKMSTTKIIVIIVVIAVVATVIFLGIVAIALGVGLGIGLQKSSPVSSKLPPPVVTCDATQATCGCASTKPAFSTRIINGNAAVANSWPWMVYLTMNGTKICSGFLITTRHVLTAASCVMAYASGGIVVSYGGNAYPSIITGINVTNETSPPMVSTFDTVAVVTLSLNLTITAPSTVRPCCLPSDPSQPYTNQNGVIAGWGETSINNLGIAAPTLQQAVVQTRDPSVCNLQSGSNEFCASFDSISTCPLDDGGPFMVSSSNAWTCVGIITGGTSCTNPITFIRIAPYLAFIKSITGP